MSTERQEGSLSLLLPALTLSHAHFILLMDQLSVERVLWGEGGRPLEKELELEHLCQVSFCLQHRFLRGI